MTKQPNQFAAGLRHALDIARDRRDQAERVAAMVRAEGHHTSRLNAGIYQLNELIKAREVFEDLAMRKPGDGAVIAGLLMVYERQKEYSRAKELLQNWVEAHPNDVQAQNRLQRFEEMAQDSTP